MKNKKLNKKGILIILLVVIIILLAVLAIILKPGNKNKSNNNSNKKEDNTKLTLNNAKELMYNDWLLSYIIEGDVVLGDGTAQTSDGTIIYAVNDPLLESFHSVEDIMELIENTMLPEREGQIKAIFSSGKYNRYFSFNDNLYMIKTDKICTNMPVMDKDKITFEQIDTMGIIYLGSLYTKAYYTDETNKWGLLGLSMNCLDIEYEEDEKEKRPNKAEKEETAPEKTE